jgi:hypothetical protein
MKVFPKPTKKGAQEQAKNKFKECKIQEFKI